MGLQEQFDEVRYNESGIDTSHCVGIADNHAIRFSEWLKLPEYRNEYLNNTLTTEQLLEIYKKQL